MTTLPPSKFAMNAIFAFARCADELGRYKSKSIIVPMGDTLVESIVDSFNPESARVSDIVSLTEMISTAANQ
jgi:hypothetical protein